MRGKFRFRAIFLLLLVPAHGVAVGFLLSVSGIPFVRSTCRGCGPHHAYCGHGEQQQTLSESEICLEERNNTEKEATTSTTHVAIHTTPETNKRRNSRAFLHRVQSALGFTTSNVPLARRLTWLSAVADDTVCDKEEPSSVAVAERDERPASVHLKLGSEAMKPKKEKEESDNEQKTGRNETQTAILHTYNDPKANVSLSGLNVPRRKFAAWVNYTLHDDDATRSNQIEFDPSLVQSSEIRVDNEDIRSRLRDLWRERRLLSDRTEVLATYKSDAEGQKDASDDEAKPVSKRGGFPDLLHIYAERLSAIIEDEIDEEKVAKGELRFFPASGESEEPIPRDLVDILDGGLLGWLEREYGEQETEKLCAANMLQLSKKDQYETLQTFLEWFRGRFPYYYDRCDSCGASAKDDPPPPAEDKESSESSDENDESDGTFLGYVYPSKKELLGKASRTEIYQCHKCGAFTRFARYNAASSVIKHERGRCGEYSMLLFRMLRALGHESRWVVDWADHVWAEVRLNDDWIHLDPCEAAVDKPLLYQEWGKQQTYIVAFHAPSPGGVLQSANMTAAPSHHQRRVDVSKFPLIEDVTMRYTSDGEDIIRKRRDETVEELNHSMERVSTDLEHKLNNLLK